MKNTNWTSNYPTAEWTSPELVTPSNGMQAIVPAVVETTKVTLDITPGVPHVFQAYYPLLDEAAAALDRAGQFLSAHLTGADRAGEGAARAAR